MPFIKVHGDPLLLLNILERNFILFGIVFTPQDLHLFALAMITLMLFIVLFTVVFGRLFCGWICPQTIFMEMVFRKIEYWIEGDANKQRKLAKSPWTSEKIFKKGLKTVIFFTIAVLIANTFLSYIIGVDQVIKIATEPIAQNLQGFIAMVIFSAIFYFVFAYMREQVCIAVCPYGRLQSVLLMKDSVVVGYDWVRGEPRGKIRKKRGAKLEEPVLETPKLGDCVDCKLCVQVCPTGIDIRNGTQLECVNCTACIDACDTVMEKVGRPKGLIRYDSLNGIEKGVRKIFTPRVFGYSSVLTLLIGLQVVLFATRTEVESVVLRTPGMLYQTVDDTYISNLYNYQIINKTTKDIADIEFKLISTDGRIKVVGNVPMAAKQSMAEGAFFIEMEKDKLTNRKTKLNIEVYSNGKLIDKAKTNFLGPFK
jgi:cytochrome c oxidase accessory protein FixG